MTIETTEKKKPGPKPKLPKVSVLERRLKNPFASAGVPITLKTPGQWEIRWVLSARAGRLYDMTHNKGWEFITPEELHGDVKEYGLKAVDNRLVRGDHGEEVLMKMPREMFMQIRQAKAAQNLKGLGKQAMRETAAQATAKEHGSQAGDAVFNAFDRINVTDSRGLNDELEQGA